MTRVVFAVCMASCGNRNKPSRVNSLQHRLSSHCVLAAFCVRIDIIGAMIAVWRVRGKIIRSVLCSIVCNNCAQCNAHTLDSVLSHWASFTVLRFIMAALCSRCGHYIFALWFLSFYPRLISSAADWMSTILLHMVWP